MSSSWLPIKIVENDSYHNTGFRKWIPLFVMSLALAIIILDTTILNVTLRTIIEDLHTSLHDIQWVITAYSLMLAAFTITGGRMGDLFGRKKMFVVGAIIFAIGSFMTSMAQSVGFMIWGEAIIEGIGACLMMPATASLLRSTYHGRDMQLAFGMWGGIVAASAALGPVLGGWFTTHYSWRWAFRINVVVVIILLLSSIYIREYKEKAKKPTIDIVGVLLSSLGLLSIVWGFIQAQTYGWWIKKAPLDIFGHIIDTQHLSATPLFLLLGVCILALFVTWELYREHIGKTPLVATKLFRNRTFVLGATLTGALSIGQAGLGFSIPVYFQAVLKLDPLHTGIAMIPMTAVILISAPLAAVCSKWIAPKYIIQLGIVLDFLSFVVMRNSLHLGAGQWALAPGFVLFGLGMGLIMSQTNTMTLSAVSVEQSGEAAGVNNTFRSLGQTLGSAVMGTILLTSMTTNIVTGINQSTKIPVQAKAAIDTIIEKQASNISFGGDAQLAQAHAPAAVVEEITTISHQATVDANRTTLAYSALLILVAMIVSFFLPATKEIHAVSAAPNEGN